MLKWEATNVPSALGSKAALQKTLVEVMGWTSAIVTSIRYDKQLANFAARIKSQDQPFALNVHCGDESTMVLKDITAKEKEPFKPAKTMTISTD